MKKFLFWVVAIGLLCLGNWGVFASNDYTPCNPISGVNDIPEIECEALVDFYYSTNGDGWVKGYSGWAGEAGKKWRLTGTKAGDWWGIGVQTGHVVAMWGNDRLSNNNLSWILNPSLWNLTEMQNEFRINGNPNLVGTFPKELKNWKKITTIYVTYNGLNWELPPELSEWENIGLFGIWANKFTGTLPPAYRKWTTINSFLIENNNFEGELPPEYWDWNLKSLTANNNKLTWKLPESYGNWTGIMRFEIWNNQLYGTIPTTYENWLGTGFQTFGFNVQNNMLSGDIPEGFKNRTSINENIFVSNNCFNIDLTGAIGNWVDSNAVERPFSWENMLNISKSLIGSWWRLTQNHCLPAPEPTPVPSNWWGGSSLKKDVCPNGDFSPSYYDGECESKTSENWEPENIGEWKQDNNSLEFSGDNSPTFSNEILSAYQFAYSHDITTLAPLASADPQGTVIRGHLAKMVVNYALNVLWKTPDTTKDCSLFSESITNETEELKQYMIFACQLDIMGVNPDTTPIPDFMPNKEVSRAEFGTVLSRMFYGEKYNNGETYYSSHLQALKEKGIITQIDNPEERIELRQWVWLMLMRSAK